MINIDILRIARSILNRLGWDIGKISDHSQLLKTLNIDCIVDAGSNDGSLISAIVKNLNSKNIQILSFEPNPKVFQILQKKSKNYPHWKTFNVGLGNKIDYKTLNVSSYSQTSSFDHVSNHHPHYESKKSWFNRYINRSKELILDSPTIKIFPLDHYFPFIQDKNTILIKIDCEGYEKKIIQGAPKFLNKATLIIIEIAIQKIYPSSPTFNEIYSILHDYDFEYIGNYGSNNVLNFILDCVFLKKTKLIDWPIVLNTSPYAKSHDP